MVFDILCERRDELMFTVTGTNGVYLPIAWDTHVVPEMSKAPQDYIQDYINEDILDHCDILVALFQSSLGSATGRSKSATVEEIMRHAAYGKKAMVYFSKEKLDIDEIDLKKVNKLKKWKEDIRRVAMYG